MLSCSSNTQSALSSSNRIFKLKAQVTRNDSGAKPIDISDRVLSSQITHDYDSRNGTANITLDNYDFLLSPLNRTSSLNLVSNVYNPLLDANHKLELFEGVQASDGSIEYIKKFTGYLGDEIDTSASSSTVTISCRDGSKLLQDKYIYQSKSYSLWVVEDVIQDLINMYAPEFTIQVNVTAPTQYVIGRADNPYTAQNVNVWDAIQTLADGASQELRFMEDGTLILRPVVLDFWGLPVDFTLDESSLVSDDQQINDTDVRNWIQVKVDSFNSVTVSSNASIAKYGTRYMEVDRSLTDTITSQDQVQTLAINMLKDLAYPKTIETGVVPLNPLYQVGDIVAVNSPRTGVNSDDDIFFVTTIQDEFTPQSKRTTVTLKGYNSFDNEVSIAPKPVTALTVGTISRTIQNYTNSGWTGYEKTIYYPLITWTPPTQDISGNALDKSFGSYIISRNGKSIASVPSYISAVDLTVNYFYDYGISGGTNMSYSIQAINNHGSKSSVATKSGVNIPYPVRKDKSGNVLS